MADHNEAKFRQVIAPHFEAAFNLARWLTQNDADAADVLQDASFKAFRFIDSQSLENPKAWFFQIVRNTAYTLLKKRKLYVETDANEDMPDTSPSAEDLILENSSAQVLYAALNDLDLPYREILILRELEDMSYEEIAETLQVPEGTVMSRLARARTLLKKKLLLEGGRL